MSNATVSLENYRDTMVRRQALLAGQNQPWLLDQRRTAADTFAGQEFPQRRQEAWRYTSVEKLLSRPFDTSDPSLQAIDERDVGPYQLQDIDAHRLVIANGRFMPALSEVKSLPEGVVLSGLHQCIETLPDFVSAWLGKAAVPAAHRFTAMNSAMTDDGLCIHIPASVRLEHPIEVLYLTVGQETATVSQPRNLVVLEPGAQATLIERYISPGDAVYFNNALTEVFLQEDAELTQHCVQQESRNAFHLHSLYINQASRSRYSHTGFALGASWARQEINLDFSGADATARLDGLYTAGDQQLTDVHINIRHALPGCESQTSYKGLLNGKGRAVFDGRIVVEPQAQKTAAHLKNANLLLTRNAEVDTKPQLEIYADDVKCSHGATVGQLEPDQLFYLRSRGIDTLEAYHMLCLGFAREIVEQCNIMPLREVVEAALSEKLAGTQLTSGQSAGV